MKDCKVVEIKKTSYQKAEIQRGYSNTTLHLNLSKSEIFIAPLDKVVKKRFIGGRGFDLWYLWKSVSHLTNWDDAENSICISSGPLGGTPTYPGSGKSVVATISPLTGMAIDSNVGGQQAM